MIIIMTITIMDGRGMSMQNKLIIMIIMIIMILFILIMMIILIITQ